jgi:hypothetical protein
MGCPVAMGIAALRLKRRSIAFRIAIVACDSLLSIFQLLELLPHVE